MFRTLIAATVLPPLVVIPMHVLWMIVLIREDAAQFGYSDGVWQALRFSATFFYPLALVVHFLVAGVATVVIRKFSLTGPTWWYALYLGPLTLAALKFSDTWLDLKGSGRLLIFAAVICTVSWPLVRSVVSSR